ncbi:hypothetical protein [Bacillus paralicheniformis]|uniref:hypothetical protein n=1 Tax=Bacillus paralicheniformis TaxID=1648923 RepID=UPI00119E5C67|nr:hypothetical protein [Bacillus paralicheniformis]
MDQFLHNAAHEVKNLEESFQAIRDDSFHSSHYKYNLAHNHLMIASAVARLMWGYRGNEVDTLRDRLSELISKLVRYQTALEYDMDKEFFGGGDS